MASMAFSWFHLGSDALSGCDSIYRRSNRLSWWPRRISESGLRSVDAESVRIVERSICFPEWGRNHGGLVSFPDLGFPRIGGLAGRALRDQRLCDIFPESVGNGRALADRAAPQPSLEKETPDQRSWIHSHRNDSDRAQYYQIRSRWLDYNRGNRSTHRGGFRD